MLSIGSENDGADTGQIDRVAGMNDAVGLARDGRHVSAVVVARDVGIFAILPVIEKLADCARA